ncbi:reverse transcriptase domain-containing protein [Tanacetum coccineum]
MWSSMTDVQSKQSLRSNADVFAWTHADMTRIPRTIMIEGKPFKTEHKLNEYSHIRSIKQKRRGLGPDRSTTACKELEELTKAEILRKVKHQTWVANPVLVKKSNRWNLEAYVDDMVIKITSEEDILAHIKETLERFRSMNMKLNLKKCSFSVEEGSFLGHLITKQGIRAIPSKARGKSNTLGNEEICRELANAHSTDARRGSNNVPHSFDKEHKGGLIHMKRRRAGARLMLIDSKGKEYTYALRFEFETTNNEAAYEALLAGLRIAQEMEIQSAIRKAAENDAITAGNEWSFSYWGVNILGPLPTAPGGFKFLAIAIEHSTKWVEAKPLTTISGRHTERFVWEYVVCRFGVPRTISSKEEKHFREGIFADLCKRLKVTESFSPVTEHMEIMNHIKKQLTRSQQGWVDDLAQVLWVHRTLLRNSQKVTPFNLTYGSKAIIPIAENTLAKDGKRRTKEVTKKKEGKEVASIKETYYQNKLHMYHNERSSHSTYKIGDFILLSQNDTGNSHVWQGPHMISEVHEGELYKISDAFDHSLIQIVKGTSLWKRQQELESSREQAFVGTEASSTGVEGFATNSDNQGKVAVARSLPA